MQQIKDVMSRDVKILNPEAAIKDAAKQMRDGDFGLMPIGENDRLVGTLSDRDIVIRALADGKGADTKVREIMSTEVIWAYEDDSIEKASQIMSDKQVRRLPIVNSDKRLVGVVALGDLAVDGSDARVAGDALTNISMS